MSEESQEDYAPKAAEAECQTIRIDGSSLEAVEN
jgi:hypothetical protein